MQNDGFRRSEQILGNNAESGLGKFFLFLFIVFLLQIILNSHYEYMNKIIILIMKSVRLSQV